MKSSTEVLRELLDERGVKHNDPVEWLTYWHDTDGHVWSASEMITGLLSVSTASVGSLTPEQAIAATLGSCSCTGDCTNSGRTGTCTADETDRIECGTIDGRHYDIHVMECSECGRTYEHVNGDYEFCPHCGRRIEVDA